MFCMFLEYANVNSYLKCQTTDLSSEYSKPELPVNGKVFTTTEFCGFVFLMAIHGFLCLLVEMECVK